MRISSMFFSALAALACTTILALGAPTAHAASDMSVTASCTPLSGPPGTSVSCTMTCQNAGPDLGTATTCGFTNIAALSSTQNCNSTYSVSLTPASGDRLKAASPGDFPVGQITNCSFSFVLGAQSSPLNIIAAASASNEGNATNNNVTIQIAANTAPPVPTLNVSALLLLATMLMMMGVWLHRSRRAD